VSDQDDLVAAVLDGFTPIGDDHPVVDETRQAVLDHLLARANEARVQPRAFVLERLVDETGISGTGVVAEGVRFSDGTVALRWTGAWPTSVVFHERGIDSVNAVHGHGGKTRIVWCEGGAT
jgi:hypothetical protein